MPRLIDTHCHLAHGRLYQQVEAVLDRARDAGVAACICATGTLQDSRTAMHITREHPGVFCTAGVHPHDAKEAPDGYVAQIEQLAADPRNVAIGEIGLDYHYDFSPRNLQRRVFAEQLDLARRLGKPAVIHTREAFEDTLVILAESGADATRVVFQSFTGGADETRRVLDLGATISFSGIATFKKSDDIRESVALVPDDRILIETDAPFLTPEPVRKMRTNEPANVAHVAERLAAVRGTTGERFAERTTTNAQRFFGLGDADNASE